MSALPAGFEELEPFVAFWAVAGTANRDLRRGESSPEQRLAFFEAMRPRLQQALALLDEKRLGDLDETEQRLMNLLLSFAHVTLAVEMMDQAEPRHASFRKEMRITRSPADS